MNEWSPGPWNLLRPLFPMRRTDSICIQKGGLHVSKVSASTKNDFAIWKEVSTKTFLLWRKYWIKKLLGDLAYLNYSIVERYFGILTASWQKPRIPQSRDCVLCSAVQILKRNECYRYRLRFCVCSEALRHKGIKFSCLETVKCFLHLII